jgi:hypothetical protein
VILRRVTQSDADKARARSLLRFAKSLRKQYGISELPARPDPKTGRRRPEGYYVADFYGKPLVKD